jgi:hypothetical protein
MKVSEFLQTADTSSIDLTKVVPQSSFTGWQIHEWERGHIYAVFERWVGREEGLSDSDEAKRWALVSLFDHTLRGKIVVNVSWDLTFGSLGGKGKKYTNKAFGPGYTVNWEIYYGEFSKERKEIVNLLTALTRAIRKRLT